MRQFPNTRMGVDQGDEVIFSDFEDGGEMWTGKGPRSRHKAVTFAEPFRNAPVVHVALSLWDVDSDTNVRAELRAEEITERGFDLVFSTWGDTRVARVRISWLAIGELPHPDDWELY